MVITGFTNYRLQKYFNLKYEVNKLLYSKAITAQTKNLFENDFNRIYNNVYAWQIDQKDISLSKKDG